MLKIIQVRHADTETKLQCVNEWINLPGEGSPLSSIELYVDSSADVKCEESW